MNKSIVLIHGAWHGAWCFDPVTQLLENQGHSVHTLDLPLTGADDDIAEARRLIQQHPGAVVLGHSYGGFLITHAAIDLDVSHLVYLAAMMPDVQEDLMVKMAAAPPAPALNNAMIFQDDGLIAINPELGAAAFYQDCDQDDARAAMSKLRPMVLGPYPVLEGTAAWQQVPSTYVICKDDRALHPELQQDLATRAQEVIEWEGGHSPFLSQPELVASLLAKLAA